MALTLYLDQSDLSYLACDQSPRRDADRLHLEALARRGAVRLRVSFAHVAEITRVKRERQARFMAYLFRMTGLVHACASPEQVCAAEAVGLPVDLEDCALADMGAWRVLVGALRTGMLDTYARAVARSDGTLRSLIREMAPVSPAGRLLFRRPRAPAATLSQEPALRATTLRATLRDAVQWNLDRNSRVSDSFDEAHITYACYSDIATVDKHVFEVTRKARETVARSTTWFKTDSLREVLDHVERRLRRGGW